MRRCSRRRRRGRKAPAVAGLAALLAGAAATAFFTTYPQIDRISEQIIGNTGDSGLNIYLLEWQLHAVTRDPGSYFDLNIFAPERFTLFWGPSLIPLVPLYALLKLCGGIIPAFNLLMVLTSFATLIATYYFTRTAGFDPLGSAVGAVMFSTTGQRMSHLGHLDSIQTLWIPVFAALLLKSWQLNRVGTDCCSVGARVLLDVRGLLLPGRLGLYRGPGGHPAGSSAKTALEELGPGGGDHAYDRRSDTGVEPPGGRGPIAGRTVSHKLERLLPPRRLHAGHGVARLSRGGRRRR